MRYPNPYQNAFATDIKRFQKLANECYRAGNNDGYALFTNMADVYKLQRTATIERKLDTVYFWARRLAGRHRVVARLGGER